MRKIEGIIEVEEVQEVISEGTTEPVRCRLQNGMYAVVKYMKNRWGQQILVNELVGSEIADVIELTIPEYGVCNLSKEVIINTNYNEEIDENNSGYAFYTQYYSKAIPPNRMMLSLIRNKEAERLMLFDHIINNADRHDGNLLYDMRKDAKLYSIDNSHIITANREYTMEAFDRELETTAIFSKHILEKNKEIYDMLCEGVGYNEEIMLAEAKVIKEKLTEEIMEKIKISIPEMWVSSVGSDEINKIFEILNKRIASICEISEMIVEERRKL